MAEILTTEVAPTAEERRCRGRPQLRCDEETRALIYAAARDAFTDNGFAATSMETLARRAGISTKTLYRLVPNKVALFEGMISERLDRVSASINLHAADHTDLEQALVEALMACACLTLGPDTMALQRMVLQERCTFSDIAATFYRNGIKRTQAALADWLRTQEQRHLIALDDAEDAAGMLLGMIVSAPQRAAIFGGQPLPSRDEIEKRVRTCAALFLRGCKVAA